MGNYNFDKDLQESLKDNDLICNLLSKIGMTSFEICDTKDYDIKFINPKDNQTYTIEIKHDYLYNKTGNIAIEYVSRYKQSGISTSKADIWCYILGNEAYMITKNKLVNFIKNNSFKKVSGGDNQTSELYLIPVKKFKESCKVYQL
jgi:hypothetical protein